jgi:SAM-dependent methyltransferase
MQYTGERMIPEEASADTFWEHIYRYRFAADFVKGKQVLDIACGEGYGSASLLKAGATSVLGVDISEEACQHAREKYGIQTMVGDAQNIPVPPASVDVVVSFETIEHVPEPYRFLDECVRILRPGGVAVISTPNKNAYQQLSPNNPYHCAELTNDEFARLCEARFSKIHYYSQRPLKVPWWDLRGISAIDWAPRKVRGMTRLSRFITRQCCGHLAEHETKRFRATPLAALELTEGSLSSFVDPYVVRPQTVTSRESDIYTIAVASR